MMVKEYKGIDLGRIFFACTIPFLHIPFKDSTPIEIIQQYISRIGVPFFFAVSGFFLALSIEKIGNLSSWKRYSKRISVLLSFWLLVYLPILIIQTDSYVNLFRQILFKTPAFLWYLSSLLFAAIPFCLMKNRKLLFLISCVLFIIGTLYGDSYRWFFGGAPSYERFFLTTRNGLFFALPLMCTGELSRKIEFAENAWIKLIVFGALLALEITFVGMHTSANDDRSMYILLPPFMLYFIAGICTWNPAIEKTSKYRGISSAIYMMQFGIITISIGIMECLNVSITNTTLLLVWLLVVLIPTFFYRILDNTRITHIIF